MEEDSDHMIPAEFYSEYEERPFKACYRCGETLKDFEDGYQVGKVYRRGETIFEYALCHPCHVRMMDEVSSESRERLEAFQAEHLQLNLGRQFCAVCGISRADIPDQEYSLAGIFEGVALIHSLTICGSCTEHMNSLLSQKTRDVWRDFINENFPGVPADALPDPNKILVM
jgi:hypothetical protein